MCLFFLSFFVYKYCFTRILQTDEDNYDSLEETIDQTSVHLEVDDKNDVIQELKTEDGLLNLPTLPPRPPENQYIDLSLLPINKTEHSVNDNAIILIHSSFTSNSDQTDNSLLSLNDTSDVQCNDEVLSIFNINSLNLTEESNENIDEIRDGIKPALTLNTYDSLTISIACSEENKYFSFSDDRHNSTSVDTIEADKEGYLVPSEPVDEDHNKDKIDVQKEIENTQNDGYINLIKPSLKCETYTVDSFEPNDINIDSYIGSPSLTVMTYQIDFEDKQSYIHPIDSNDLSPSISCGYDINLNGRENISNV